MDDVTMGGMSLGQKGSAKGANKSTDREPTQRRPQDALRTFSASAGCQRRSLHVLDDQARGTREQGTEKAIVRLLGTGGDQGQGTRLGPAGIAAFTGLWQALSERGSTVRAANAARVANLKQTWDELEPEGAFDLIASWPKCTTQLELVISVAQQREHVRGALRRTGANRLLGQAASGALERGTVSRDRTELKKVNLVAASLPDTPIRPRVRQVDWRQGIASDKELMDRATGKMVGTGGSAVSSMLGQLLTSAEIEIEDI